MKATIHPPYYPDAKIVCACGNTMTVGSSVQEIHVELCSKCHPFYTGTQKLIDTSRRIEKFAEKKSAQATKGAKVTGKKVKTEKRAAQKAAKKAQKAPTHLDESNA
jgi:large subunit ribosomal protein L31